MLDSNTILGIRGRFGCENYSHAILTQNLDCWPCGVPVVYPSDIDLDYRRNPATHVGTLITPCQVSGGVEQLNVHSRIVHPVNLRPLCGNHKVLTVSEFDIGKLDRLIEFIHDVGGVSLVIERMKGRQNLIKGIVNLANKFRYNSTFHYNEWGSRYLDGEDDSYLCVLTFLDLPYCVPLFNMNKIDGIGLSLSGVTLKASMSSGQLHRTFRADLIYSNYEENVFVIDGVEVNRKSSTDHKMYDSMAGYAGQTLEISDGKNKKLKLGGCYITNEAERVFEESSVDMTSKEPNVKATEEEEPPVEAESQGYVNHQSTSTSYGQNTAIHVWNDGQ